MSAADHWTQVYATKAPDQVSWFAPQLRQSLAFIDRLALPPAARAIDVGGGASTLVDDLLARGFVRPTVLDLAVPALAASRARLGDQAGEVDWVVGDVTQVVLPTQTFDLWHDRAVFHFLTEPEAQARYLAQLRRALRPGGAVVLATFAADGPERCSGLPVQRYDAQGQQAALGAEFEPVAQAHMTHQTPWGSAQAFQFGLFRWMG